MSDPNTDAIILAQQRALEAEQEALANSVREAQKPAPEGVTEAQVRAIADSAVSAAMGKMVGKDDIFLNKGVISRPQSTPQQPNVVTVVVCANGQLSLQTFVTFP